jgi:bifunctional ADP-heptose synthase (sugar kinase/adenylyltransferase)
MIPRGKGDVSDQIEVLIPKMNHPDWIKRKQSAETVINLLSEIQGRLSFSCTNDLLATLKFRIADPNKQLIRIFVDLTGMMFEIMS